MVRTTASITSLASWALRSAAGRRWRSDVEDRNRYRGHRHALREPVLHGGGRWGRRPPGGGRLQLGISRGSPEQVVDGWRYFGYQPAEDDAEMARRHAEVFLELLEGEGSAESAADVPEPAEACCPSSPIRQDSASVWWGAASPTTAAWAAAMGMNLMSSTLVFDDASGDPSSMQARHIHAFREAWREAGHERDARLRQPEHLRTRDDMDRAYFGKRDEDGDHVGYIDENTQAVFGRTRQSPKGSPRNSPRTRR